MCAAPVIPKTELTRGNVLVVDDALSPEEFETCRRLVDGWMKRGDPQYCTGLIYRRYESESPDPRLLHAIERVLAQPRVQHHAKRCPDLAWRWLAAGATEVAHIDVTSYGSGAECSWHSEHREPLITHNVVLFLSSARHFSGGWLDASLDDHDLLARGESQVRRQFCAEPRKNRLVVMPSYLLRRVTPVKCRRIRPSLWETRLTLDIRLRVKPTSC